MIHNQIIKKAELLYQIEKIRQSSTQEEGKIQIISELQSQIENINLEICEIISNKNTNIIQGTLFKFDKVWLYQYCQTI